MMSVQFEQQVLVKAIGYSAFELEHQPIGGYS
jgi:hypothetical protein